MRVLVVEDEVRLAEAIASGLTAEGCTVDTVHDGAEGYRQALEHDFDAIVLDILLPGLNGYRVCARLREQGDWTPILMLTAKDGEYDEADALDTGADDFVSKPFSFVVLVARLRALVRRGARPRPTVLRIDDLVLDPASGVCRRGGHEISLTPKEFTVLELLARRSGQVVSKRDIMAGCWDFAYEGDPNVIEVHISALRRKIDTPFGRRSIRTVRGLGYRLSPETRGG